MLAPLRSLAVMAFVLILLAFLGISRTYGQSSGEAVLFQDNFESGKADAWQLTGTDGRSGKEFWQVEQEPDGNWVMSGTEHTWGILTQQKSWSDFTYKARVKIIPGSRQGLHLNFRLGRCERYFIAFHPNQISLSKTMPCNTHTNLVSSPGNHEPGRWYTIQIVGKGNRIQVYVDGTLRIDHTDQTPVPTGGIGIETLDGSHVHIDDVVVTGSAPTPTPTPVPGASWVRTGGPLGGLGYDIRMRQDNPDIMYVTDAWAGVHMSTDGGRTWMPMNAGIDVRLGPSGDAIPVFCLTIDPNNNDIVWIGTQGVRGIYRSVDGGKTWQKRTTGIVEDRGLTIRGISVEPGNSNVVYAAAEISSREWAGKQMHGRNFDLTKGVVYKSTDAGARWQPIWRGDNLARYVLIDPMNVNTLYVSTGIFDREAANSDPKAYAPGGVGVLKSTDGGKTWAQINEGLRNLYIGSLFMHPRNPQILLAGAANNAYRGGGGIYLTTDGGARWKHTDGTHITSVEFAASDPNIAYAGGDQEFYFSNDGGNRWQRVPRYFVSDGRPEGIRPGFAIDFQVDPRNARRIFMNNYGGGNFLSEDDGKTWISASTGYTGADLTDVAVHPNNPAVVYVNGRSGPFMSNDGGKVWRGLNFQDIAEGARVTLDPSNSNHVLMSSAHWGWTYESDKGGAEWRQVTNYNLELQSLPHPDTNQKHQGMQAIAFAPSNPQKVYGGFGVWRCATDAEDAMCNTRPIVSILLSDDGGRTWRRLGGTAVDGYTVTEIVVHPTNADVAWAATAGGGVFRTNNGGSTWTSVSTGLTDRIVMDLALDPKTPEVLYAGTASRGVFKTLDGGAAWRSVSAGMNPNEPIGALVVNPVQPNIVYAGSWSSGVFMSVDAGASWRLFNDGLRTRSVRALAISSDGKVLYAGTRGEGVFRFGAVQIPTPTPTSASSPTSTVVPASPASAATPRPGATSAPTRAPTPTPSSTLPCLAGFAFVVPLVAFWFAQWWRGR